VVSVLVIFSPLIFFSLLPLTSRWQHLYLTGHQFSLITCHRWPFSHFHFIFFFFFFSPTLTPWTWKKEIYSCYLPGCIRDDICNCDICLASTKASFDLEPVSIQKYYLSKLSSSSANVGNSLLSFAILHLSLHEDQFIILKWSLQNSNQQ